MEAFIITFISLLPMCLLGIAVLLTNTDFSNNSSASPLNIVSFSTRSSQHPTNILSLGPMYYIHLCSFLY